MKAYEFVTEKWSQKYKNSINCSHPKGFSQRAHCAGKRKHNEDITMEQVCPDCGMCQTHGNLNEIKKGAKDSNGYTKCWPGRHAEGTKKGRNGGQVRNCVPNESVTEAKQLSIEQLATISDAALDAAYHYGRSQPGNTFGWQANLKSAAFAKQMIDRGITDIEQISNAIHKGWNVTAQAFVKNPMMFDDSKTMAPEKLEAKIAQRQKLMTQQYAQLPEEEKEKDRVVARAMLQAITGQQQSKFDQYQQQRNTPAKNSAEYINRQANAKPGDPVPPPFQKGVAEAANPAQQAAIAIAKKKELDENSVRSQIGKIELLDYYITDDSYRIIAGPFESRSEGHEAFEKLVQQRQDIHFWQGRALIVKLAGLNEEELDEFAPGGGYQEPPPPVLKKKDPFDDDDRSIYPRKIQQLLTSGAKVDSRVPGAMGHIIAANGEMIRMKPLNKPHSQKKYAWYIGQDRDDKLLLKQVEPNHYVLYDRDWLPQGVAEELTEEFDLIESIIDDLAEHNGVDAEVIWEDLESLDDDELYVFATTSTIMETEAWQKANNRDRTDGMSKKAVKTYRREHPGSKLQTAVTTKPSKLKKGSKASKRRKSYCSRSRGQMKMHSISCAKTPDKAICKARRRWNC